MAIPTIRLEWSDNLHHSPSKHQLQTFFPLHQRGKSPSQVPSIACQSSLQFDLVDKKELAPLDELNDAILAEDKGR